MCVRDIGDTIMADPRQMVAGAAVAGAVTGAAVGASRLIKGAKLSKEAKIRSSLSQAVSEAVNRFYGAVREATIQDTVDKQCEVNPRYLAAKKRVAEAEAEILRLNEKGWHLPSTRRNAAQGLASANKDLRSIIHEIYGRILERIRHIKKIGLAVGESESNSSLVSKLVDGILNGNIQTKTNLLDSIKELPEIKSLSFYDKNRLAEVMFKEIKPVIDAKAAMKAVNAGGKLSPETVKKLKGLGKIGWAILLAAGIVVAGGVIAKEYAEWQKSRPRKVKPQKVQPIPRRVEPKKPKPAAPKPAEPKQLDPNALDGLNK